MTGVLLSGNCENMDSGTLLFVCLLIIAEGMEGVRINLYLPRPCLAGLQDDVFLSFAIFSHCALSGFFIPHLGIAFFCLLKKKKACKRLLR